MTLVPALLNWILLPLWTKTAFKYKTKFLRTCGNYIFWGQALRIFKKNNNLVIDPYRLRTSRLQVSYRSFPLMFKFEHESFGCDSGYNKLWYTLKCIFKRKMHVIMQCIFSPLHCTTSDKLFANIYNYIRHPTAVFSIMCIWLRNEVRNNGIFLLFRLYHDKICCEYILKAKRNAYSLWLIFV